MKKYIIALSLICLFGVEAKPQQDTHPKVAFTDPDPAKGVPGVGDQYVARGTAVNMQPGTHLAVFCHMNIAQENEWWFQGEAKPGVVGPDRWAVIVYVGAQQSPPDFKKGFTIRIYSVDDATNAMLLARTGNNKMGFIPVGAIPLAETEVLKLRNN